MKLDPVFCVKNNSLCFVDGSDAGFENPAIYSLEEFCKNDLPDSKYIFVLADHNEIEIEEELYNEELLASFREKLLLCDEIKQYVIIVPVSDRDLTSALQFESFTNTFNHTVRRVKDCNAVAGFELPENLLENITNVTNFIEVIAKKHAQFVYFAKKSTVEKLNIFAELQEKNILMY